MITDRVYGISGVIKLNLHWRYGQLSTINLDKIDTAKVHINWTKERNKELDWLLTNNQLDLDIDYIGLDKHDKYNLRTVVDNTTNRPILEPVNKLKIKHGMMKVTINRDIHAKIINKKLECRTNQHNIAKIKNYLDSDRFSEIIDDS